MVIQQLCHIFRCNLIQSHLLWKPAARGSNPVKSCTNYGRSLHHNAFKLFTDTSSKAVLMLSMPFKMSNMPTVLDSFVWTVQTSHHFHEGLVEETGFKDCSYPLVLWLKKWYGVWWHVNNTDIQRCTNFRKVCGMARGIVQEKNLWLVTHSSRKMDHGRAKILYVPIQEDLVCQPSPSVPSPVNWQHSFV